MNPLTNPILRGGFTAAVALVGFAATPLQAQTLTNRYEFNDNVNSSVLGGANGTLSTDTAFLDAPLFVSTVPTGAGAGAPTKSIEFGADMGQKSFFTLATSALSPVFSAGSISMWIRPDTAAASQRYVFLLDPSSDGLFLTHQLSGGNQVFRANVDGAVLGDSINNTIPAWYHLALTWEQSGGNLTRTFYVNGSQVSSTTAAGAITASNQIRVGSFNVTDSATGTGNQFDGLMYDLQFYSGVLSSTQVSSLASNPGSVIPEPSSFALLAGSAAAFAFLRRRRRQS